MRNFLVIVLTIIALEEVFSLDSRTVITNFLKVGQSSSFTINSRSVNAAEKEAYTAMRDFDREGGTPDGVITYSEYLTYLNKTTPDSISPFDFALSKVLPLLRDYVVEESQGCFASGYLKTSWQIGNGVIIPQDTRIGIAYGSILRIWTTGDFQTGSLMINGGRNNDNNLNFDPGKGFYLGEFQITKDVVINRVPCKAITPYDGWDCNIQLHPDGQVFRTVLADDYTEPVTGLAFLASERVQLSPQGQPQAAILFQSREIQGKKVVAYVRPGLPLGEYEYKGFWENGNAAEPNIYFENGKIKWCYEENKVIDGVTIAGINMYQYAPDGLTVTGIVVPNSYFLGYPVKLPGYFYWGQPAPAVSIAEGKASFELDIDIQLKGLTGNVVLLPANTRVTIDLKTGSCLTAVLPGGIVTTFDPALGLLIPEQLPLAKQPQQVKAWMEKWLKDKQPESSWEWARHKDILIALDREAAFETQYAAILKLLIDQGLILYKTKSLGNVAGNIAVDINGDGKIQTAESITGTGAALTAKEILEAVAKLAVGMSQDRQIKVIRIFYEGGSQSINPNEISPVQRAVDKLGSLLARKRVQPLADKKVYYLPDGSGFKAAGDSVNLGYAAMGGFPTINFSVKDPARFSATMPDGRVILSADTVWYEKTGTICTVVVNEGNRDILLPDGNKVIGRGQTFFPSGKLMYLNSIWGGNRVMRPDGVEDLSPNSLQYHENGIMDNINSMLPVTIPLKAGQKVIISYLGKYKTITIPKDIVYTNLTAKLFFDQRGILKEILIWGNVPAEFK